MSDILRYEYETTYRVLEIAREEELLTPDQRHILNEAHAIVQEMHQME